MSTLKEVAESKVTISLKPKENFIQSFAKDLVTFSLIALCIYISQGSAWWTLVTGGMFIFMMGIKLKSLVGANTTTFKDKESAIEYLQGMDL